MARIIALPRSVTYPPLPFNAFEQTIFDDTPCWFLRMNDPGPPSPGNPLIDEMGNENFDTQVGSDLTYRNPAPGGGFAIDTQVIGNHINSNFGCGCCGGSSQDSVEFVMKRDGDPTGNDEYLFSIGENAFGVAAPTGNLIIRHKPNTAVPYQTVDTGIDVCTFNWHHIMISYAGTPATFTVWVDGVKSTHISGSGVSVPSLTNILFNRWSETFPYTPTPIETFEGSIDMIAWWRVYTFSDPQAAAHYAAYASL